MTNNYLLKNFTYKGAFLAFLFVFFTQATSAQSDYSVSSIPFQVYAATASVQGTMDDTFSAPIPLTFDFRFFGATYNQVNVSTNGYISFTPYTEGYFSPWSFSQTIPDASFPVKNAFLGCYHDLNNSNAQGTITYAVLGAAPYRKFIVLFDNQSHFSCTEMKSSFQMILYETLNIMDVQIIDKNICPTWNNGGAAVIGIVNDAGDIAFTPAERNTGSWTASQEGWRFQTPVATDSDAFTKCDDDADGLVSFNLQVAQNDLNGADPSLVSFYLAESDAISQSNALTSLTYTNTTAGGETIYANVNGAIKKIVLRVVDCGVDYDLDSVETASEDLNGDTNLANDDTDADGIANFIDNDDDGDMVLTSVEYVFNRNATLVILDTDNDSIPNYIDNDDDGDGVLTINEDYDNNHNPADDDTNANNIPDYLESAVALGLPSFAKPSELVLYPNPATTVLNIDNKSNETITNVAIYNVNGSLVKEAKGTSTVSVSELQTGIYFVKIQLKDRVMNYKFIKK